MTQWIAFLHEPLQWPPYTLLVVAAVLAPSSSAGLDLDSHEPHRESSCSSRPNSVYEAGAGPISLLWARTGFPRNGFGEYRLNISPRPGSRACTICDPSRRGRSPSAWARGWRASRLAQWPAAQQHPLVAQCHASVPVMAVVDLPGACCAQATTNSGSRWTTGPGAASRPSMWGPPGTAPRAQRPSGAG